MSRAVPLQGWHAELSIWNTHFSLLAQDITMDGMYVYLAVAKTDNGRMLFHV
ncbi:MAG: hypothetical protein RQ899_09480 [Pseudomonadales bacterium]|nr:hypothetical protein [Pseudomonadales bacterium]